MRPDPQMSKIPVHTFKLPTWECFDVQFSIVRLDQTHPQISGNKWYKLQPLTQLIAHQINTPVLSFGGAYSNHLHALAYAGHHYGFSTQGVIRGERPQSLNPTLLDMQRWGMRLHFVSRTEYAQRNSPDYIAWLKQQLGPFLHLPEGGSSAEAVHYCGEIWKHIDRYHGAFDYVGCALGTGATAAGLIAYCPVKTAVLVVPAVKVSALEAEAMLVKHWHAAGLQTQDGYQVFDGELPYAKSSPALAALWQALTTCYGIDLDPVYTLRVYHRLSKLLLQGYFKQGSKVALLHTGGLQGVRGCKTKLREQSAVFNGPLPI